MSRPASVTVLPSAIPPLPPGLELDLDRLYYKRAAAFLLETKTIGDEALDVWYARRCGRAEAHIEALLETIARIAGDRS